MGDETGLSSDVPRGDFALLPPWCQEAVRSLCWSEAAFALAPRDDRRFGLFADDLQSAALLLYRAGYPVQAAWAILCRRLPAAAQLAAAMPEKKGP